MIVVLTLSVGIIFDFALGPGDTALDVDLHSPLHTESGLAHYSYSPGDHELPCPPIRNDLTEADAEEKEEESDIFLAACLSCLLHQAPIIHHPDLPSPTPALRGDLLHELHRTWQLLC